MLASEQRTRYKAKLLAPARSIFTDSFYPEVKAPGDEQMVFFTQVAPTPTNQKVLIASRLSSNAFRMLTMQLAQHCLEPTEIASISETYQLNELSRHLEKHV
jgi:hypothetical protein